jgi:glutamate---cysteine ligase / carboxylate-amine ligase
MTRDHFRPNSSPSLGVELELQLVDSDSMELCDALHDILSRLSDSVHGGAKPEFYRSCIEINTGICLNVADVRMDLEERLRCVAQAAAESHVSLGWGGTHPFSCWRDQHMVATRRYGELADQFQETLFRQLTFGMHVHVGVPSGEAAIRACNGVRRYLPLLLALSANSPFWSGRATGLHAHRAEVMSALPASGPPPRFHDWNDYSTLIERLISGGCIKTSKDLWWDARPSPAYGTVEVRVCDMPPDLPSVLGLTALIQCLIFVLSRDLFEITDPAAEEVAIRQNRWRAARYGLDADFFDPQSGRSFPVRDLIDTLADVLTPVARTLGGAGSLAHVRRMARQPSGAEKQLEVFQKTRNLHEVARSQIISGLHRSSAFDAPYTGSGAPPPNGSFALPATSSGCPITILDDFSSRVDGPGEATRSG